MMPSKLAVNYVLKRSATCRYYKAHATWMVREGMVYLPDEPDAERTQKLKKIIRGYLKERVREHTGNPILIYILLYIVIPIVIRLLIEWWLSRIESKRGLI